MRNTLLRWTSASGSTPSKPRRYLLKPEVHDSTDGIIQCTECLQAAGSHRWLHKCRLRAGVWGEEADRKVLLEGPPLWWPDGVPRRVTRVSGDPSSLHTGPYHHPGKIGNDLSLDQSQSFKSFKRCQKSANICFLCFRTSPVAWDHSQCVTWSIWEMMWCMWTLALAWPLAT